MMRANLERLDAAVLAALCNDAAEDPAISPLVAEQARALKLEWASLIRQITPPLSNPREEEKVEAAIKQVRMCMVDHLASNQPSR
jgi:hypothetical protein